MMWKHGLKVGESVEKLSGSKVSRRGRLDVAEFGFDEGFKCVQLVREARVEDDDGLRSVVVGRFGEIVQEAGRIEFNVGSHQAPNFLEVSGRDTVEVVDVGLCKRLAAYNADVICGEFF